jgi:hypothetical protein
MVFSPDPSTAGRYAVVTLQPTSMPLHVVVRRVVV